MITSSKRRYYVSVNFVCDTDGSEPTQDQLNEALKSWLKNDSKEFEIWDDVSWNEDNLEDEDKVETLNETIGSN